MKIKVEEAVRICEKYGIDSITVTFLNDSIIKSRTGSLQVINGMRFEPSQADFFLNAGINEIDVVFDERLLAKLAANFPTVYRLPLGRNNIIDLDRLIDEIERSNASNKRKRSVISLTEIYRKDFSRINEPFLSYGEKLSPARLNEIKNGFGRTTMIDYRFDEVGIIVFFLLNASDPSYASKFMKFTDLVSIIVESKNTGLISPDLNVESDVYTVNDQEKLYDLYVETKSSLIIIGEDMNEAYRSSLSRIKTYDKFAKMMIIKNIDTSNRHEIINRIKEVYSQNLWKNL